MHNTLLTIHSVLRFAVLAFLLVVIIKSLAGWSSKSAYTRSDDKLSLGLFSLTHLQFLMGLILYFVSPAVIFSGASMKNDAARYWLVEHAAMMLIAVVLITMARITAKKMSDSVSKHKRLFIFNTIALIIIVAAISMSGRGLFTMS